MPLYESIEGAPPQRETGLTGAVDRLFGLNGQERYQMWPEKLVRDAVTAPGEVLASPTPVTSEQLIAPAQAVSALAGAGVLAAEKGALGSAGGAIKQPMMTFENYLKKVNPEGSRVLENERPNLGMGDMYGMAPKNAKVLPTKVNHPELGDVKFVQKDGDVYALAKNSDLGGEMDTVGYAINKGDGVELHVVNEAQGAGIGKELQYQFRKTNPYAKTGGLTEAGEKTLKHTYERLKSENRLNSASPVLVLVQHDPFQPNLKKVDFNPFTNENAL